LAQLVEVIYGEGGVGLFGGAKIAFDADVKLLGAALEPTAASGTERFWFFYFAQAEERAVEIAGSGFAAFGSGDLDVIEMGDAGLHAR
jgi:hypothetical protein